MVLQIHQVSSAIQYQYHHSIVTIKFWQFCVCLVSSQYWFWQFWEKLWCLLAVTKCLWCWVLQIRQLGNCDNKFFNFRHRQVQKFPNFELVRARLKFCSKLLKSLKAKINEMQWKWMKSKYCTFIVKEVDVTKSSL